MVYVTGVNLVNPSEDPRPSSIAIDELGKIASLESAPPPKADILFDGEGELYAFPGFIDIHTHGANGVDLSDANSDDIVATIAEAKLKEGVTTFLPTTWTASREHLQQMAKCAAAYRENETYARAPFLHIEGPYLNPDQAGAQDRHYMRKPDLDEIRQLNEICPIGLISLAIELDEAPKFIAEMKKDRIATSAAHSAATLKEFQIAKKAGLNHLTHFCNQMSPLHHRELGLVGAGMLDDDIKIELICDTIHLCEAMIQLIFKHRTCDQLMLITDSIAAAHLGDGVYKQGDTSIIVKDGQARNPSGNLAGSTLQFNEGLKNVVRITQKNLGELAKTTGYNQAKSLGLNDRGSLQPGKLADITLLDKDFEVQATLVGGKIRYQK